MSSNDRGDEPRVNPAVSPRQRPSRPVANGKRADGDGPPDPRDAVLGKRPEPRGRSGDSGRPVSPTQYGAVEMAVVPTTAPPHGPIDEPENPSNGSGRRASNGGSNGNGRSNGIDNGSSDGNGNGNGNGRTNANRPTVDDSSRLARPPSRRSKPSSPATTAVPATTTPSDAPVSGPPAPKFDTKTGQRLDHDSFVAVPTQPLPPVDPATTRVDPGLMPPAPVALAPQPLTGPPYVQPAPTVFDDESFHTGPVALDPSLDPDAPQRTRSRSVQFTQVGRRGRPRMRRVTRVVRHVDPWSVFKVALCFSLVLYGVCLTAGVLLWNVAYTTGTIDNVQRFFESFGWDTFRFKGGELFHNGWIAGLFASLGLTGLAVLGATLFNLITDLVGGIRVSVLEEEVVERHPVVRGPLLRRLTRPISMITDGRDSDSAGSTDHLG